MNTNKCNYCGKTVKFNGFDCDWQQGRCPHKPPMIDVSVFDKYKTKAYTFLQKIKGYQNDKKIMD